MGCVLWAVLVLLGAGCLHCVVVSGGCVDISLVFSVTVVFWGWLPSLCGYRLCCAAGCIHCAVKSGGCVAISLVFSVTVVFLGWLPSLCG